MKRILFPILCTVLLAACQEKMEDRADRDARETTEKRCPMRLNSDGSIILERINFDKPTLTWRQDFLIDLDSASSIDDIDLRGVLLQELKNMPSYKPYMNNGFKFQYVYCRMSNPKDTIINLTLTPEDYQ